MSPTAPIPRARLVTLKRQMSLLAYPLLPFFGPGTYPPTVTSLCKYLGSEGGLVSLRVMSTPLTRLPYPHQLWTYFVLSTPSPRHAVWSRE